MRSASCVVSWHSQRSLSDSWPLYQFLRGFQPTQPHYAPFLPSCSQRFTRMIIPTLLVQASCCFPPDTHADDRLCVAVYAEYSELKETEDYVWGPKGLGLSAYRLQRLSKTWKRAVDVRELLLSSACWLHGWLTERDEKIRETHFSMSIWALHAQC